MKNILLFYAIWCCLFVACNNEENDTLSPSGLEPEWFAIQITRIMN